MPTTPTHNRSPRTPRRLRDILVSRTQQRDDEGSILILALVFLLVTSLTVMMIVTWAGNSLLDATKFNQASALDYSAGAAVQIEAQSLRYSYQTTQTDPYACQPTGSSSSSFPWNKVVVYCSIVDNPDSSATRVVTMDACSTGTSAATCESAPFLQAVFSYDDYSESNQLGCSSASDQVTCGTAMSITNWNLT